MMRAAIFLGGWRLVLVVSETGGGVMSRSAGWMAVSVGWMDGCFGRDVWQNVVTTWGCLVVEVAKVYFPDR